MARTEQRLVLLTAITSFYLHCVYTFTIDGALDQDLLLTKIYELPLVRESRNIASNISNTCNRTEFQCTSGKCIPSGLKCDGHPHCDDSSDEDQLNCFSVYCDPSSRFKCRSGECVTKSWRCDNDYDCFDRSDEEGCDRDEEASTCDAAYFTCGDGACVSKKWRCDGDSDCSDGSDEQNCHESDASTCKSHMFQCRNLQCIPYSFICDGDIDCRDGTDENDCDGHVTAECNADAGYFECSAGGKCIAASLVCNDHPDCPNKSDEGGHCNEECQTKSCPGGCFMTPSGPQCTCEKGYEFNATQKQCEDVDECLGKVGVCDQVCKNMPGGYNCSCSADYKLQSDGSTCRTEVAGRTMLLFSAGYGVRVYYLDGLEYLSVYSGYQQTYGVAYDPVDDMVYWSTKDGVSKKKLKEESVPTPVLTQGVGLPENLAIDWLGRNLYIVDSEKGHILVCTLDGRSCNPIIRDIVHPRAIQVDLEGRRLYWTCVNESKIESSSMDGSNRKVLIDDGIVWPNALALDVAAKRIYWFDASHDRAEHSYLDGSDRKELPQAIADHPYSMAVWEDKVYWSDWTQDEIQTALKLTGKNQVALLKEPMQQLFGLTIHHPALFKNVRNPCSSNMCSHLCLLTSETFFGYVCGCPTHMELASDQYNCKDLPKRDYPFIGDGTHMYRVDLTLFGQTSLAPWHPDLTLQRISDMEYDPKNNRVLVSDVWAGTIIKISVATGIKQTLISNVKATGIAVDWVRDNVYWVDGLKHGVEVVRSDGNYRSLLLDGLHSPTDIAVSPLDGCFFVSDGGLMPYIMRCGLDGKMCTKIVTTNLEQPFSIVFDHDPQIKRLYWTDARLGNIEAVAMDGSARQIIQANLEEPLSLALHNQDILWSQRGSTTLHWVTKLDPTTSDIGTLDLGLPTDSSSMSSRVVTLGEMGWQIPSGLQKNECAWSNGHCEHLCLADVKQIKVCGCGLGYELAEDGQSCKMESCHPHQFRCIVSTVCIPESWKCDGTIDCSDGSDELICQAAEECIGSEFKCLSGNCISASWRCDGHHDCNDGSDESGCPPTTCSSHQWKCDSGQCIPKLWRCDGQEECQDKSDEDNCTTSCSQHQFTCTDGNCIPDSWSCDGDPDCLDGSDERECDECARGLFRCDGRCLGQHMTCDGSTDCEDGSDEDPGICQMLDSPVCANHQLDCGIHGINGVRICVPREARCNSTQECPGGEDELNCLHCRRNEFTCHSDGHCIPMRWLCDGDGDCDDSSDELNCQVAPSKESYAVNTLATNASNDGSVVQFVPINEGTTEKSSLWKSLTNILSNGPGKVAPMCDVGQFVCGIGENKCLDQALVCDGYDNCLDGSDEHGNCDTSCNNKNGGCQQICSPGPIRSVCSCYAGYELDSDGSSCLDSNECADESTCSHSCENTHGSYYCSCLPGYVLLPDRHTCKYKDGEDWSLVVSGNKLLNVSHNHLETDEKTLNVNHYISSVEYDPVTKNAFYAHRHGSIRSLSLDFNADTETIIFKDLKYPTGVSLDHVSRNLYFSEHFDFKNGLQRSDRDVSSERHLGVEVFSVIKMCNLDTSLCRFVYHGSSVKVPDTAVSTKFNYLFYCSNHVNQQRAQVFRSNLDGDDQLVLAQHKVVECGNLALDEVKQRVYWSDTALNTIDSVDWNGHNRRRVQKEMVNAPLGLEVQNSWILWSNADQHVLMRCDKYDSLKCTTLPLDDKPQGLILVKPQYTSKDDVCAEESCLQMCAPKPDGSPECSCQLGYAPSEEYTGICLLVDGCIDNPCEGGGTCEPHANGIVICRCPEGRLGKYCEIGVQPSTSSDNSTVTLVVILVILLFIVCALAYYKREWILEMWSTKMDRKSKLNFHFVNPAFGVVRDERIFVPSPVSTTAPSRLIPSPCLTANPLRKGCNHFENPSFKENYSEGDDSVDSALGGELCTSINITPHDVDLSSPIPPPVKTSTLEWKHTFTSP